MAYGRKQVVAYDFGGSYHACRRDGAYTKVADRGAFSLRKSPAWVTREHGEKAVPAYSGVRLQGARRHMSSDCAPIRLLLADNDGLRSQMLTGALRRRSEFTVQACELDADMVLQALEQSDLEVALICSDHRGPEICLPVMRRIHLARPSVAIILLSDALSNEIVVNAFRCGALGVFCQSRARFGQLCKCVKRVHEGQIWINSQQLHCLLEVLTHVPALRVVNTNGDHLLTGREEQVVALVSDGLSNREVARELNLSEHTVKKYLFRIFDKLGISTRVELVLYAVNHGGAREAEWIPG